MSIVAQPAASVTPVSRLTLLLRQIRNAALDAVAECGSGLTALARAAQADAIHDRQLVSAARAAALGAQTADLRGCGCASRFDRLGQLVANAQQADAAEDGFVERAGRLFGRGCERMRGVAGAAERAIGEAP